MQITGPTPELIPSASHSSMFRVAVSTSINNRDVSSRRRFLLDRDVVVIEVCSEVFLKMF